MIHYHGTPIGGTRADSAEFLSGRHALIPFAYPYDLSSVMDRCQSFIVDNSAFTYWKQGGEIDVEEYLNFLKKIYRHPGFDWALIPDVIDGTEEDNSKQVMKWVRSGTRIHGVPVFHFHESLEWLDWLVNNCEIIALGSSGQWPNPGTSSWWNRLNDLMGVICDAEGRPKCKLHGLRMLDPNIFRWIPLHSADSTNVAVNSGSIKRFGMYIPPSRALRCQVIADRIEQFNSSPIWIKHQLEIDI